MTYLKINDTLYPASFRQRAQDSDWNNRGSMAITVNMSHDQADIGELFLDLADLMQIDGILQAAVSGDMEHDDGAHLIEPLQLMLGEKIKNTDFLPKLK